MIQHLVWLDDALDPITDSDLAASMEEDADAILSGTLTRERGALPALEVEMAHPGWSIFAPGQRQGVALVVSEDGTMATATVRARGYFRAMPSGLTGDTLTLQFECSPEDWEDRRDAAAQAVLDADAAKPGVWANTGLSATDPSIQGGTSRDTLFGRSQHLVDDVLASRTAWIRHDPVTHDVTIVDDAVRARVHNIGDGYDPSSLQVSPGEGAVEQVKWTVFANVQESATVTTDLAPRISRQTSLLGYTAGGGNDMTQNVGWSLGTPVVEQIYSTGLPSDTGRVWRVTSRRVYYVQVPGPNGTTVTATTYGPLRVVDHYERLRRRVQTTHFKSWPATGTFNQTRRERFELTLDLQVQRVGGIKRVHDMGETSLGDLYTPDLGDSDAEIAVEGDGTTEVAEGNYVLLAGRIYQALRDTTRSPFEETYDRFDAGTVGVSQDWKDVGIVPAMADKTASSFGDLPRGKATMAHALLRMAKVALDKLAGWSVTLTCQRADIPDIELEDQVLFLLPARWDQPGREATGRVTKIVETWSGSDGETVTLTLAIPGGTGLDAYARLAVMDRYGGGGYFGARSAYVQQPTGFLTAGDRIEFTVDADPLVTHVVSRALSDVNYVLRDVTYRGSAAEQEADFAAAAARGLAPTADVTKPTAIEVSLLPLIAERTIERTFRIAGTLLTSPCGLDFSQAA